MSFTPRAGLALNTLLGIVSILSGGLLAVCPSARAADIASAAILHIACDDPAQGVWLDIDTKYQTLTETYTVRTKGVAIYPSNTYLIEEFDLSQRLKDFTIHSTYQKSSPGSPFQYRASSRIVFETSGASYEFATKTASKKWSAHITRNLDFDAGGKNSPTCQPGTFNSVCEYDFKLKCEFRTGTGG